MRDEQLCASKLALGSPAFACLLAGRSTGAASQNQQSSRRATVGRCGEDIAKIFLRSLGYRFYAQNVRLGKDEIDLIAFDPRRKTLVFVEVKARSRYSADYPPELSLTDAKREKMERSAQAWVAQRGYEGSYRLDLVCVAGGQVVDHIPNITFDCS